jgi:small subunit ribosomal protein S1
MAPSFDEEGTYIGPEGFDPETGEWKEGFEDQRATWEKEYAEAHSRWEAHRKQIEEAAEAEAEASGATEYSGSTSSPSGTLATDEALQALRDKLTGGN